jgi:electron transfer flavoprotein beta subunit
MQVAVFISGVADPKWPLPSSFDLPALAAHAAQRAALSPFDEAAIEIALKLRDADPATTIVAMVAGDEAMTRKVAGWRPDAIHRLDLSAVPRWDGVAVGKALAQALAQAAPDADVVLVGREFGDLDDGSAPPALAHAAGLALVSLALAIDKRADGWWALRQGLTGLERMQLPQRAVLSATNDPGNRLRHPLMKNVMAAKKAPLGLLQPAAPEGAGVQSEGVHPAEAPVRNTSCQMLQGSLEDKARQLADVLEAVGS